jgi:hypothetical protein
MHNSVRVCLVCVCGMIHVCGFLPTHTGVLRKYVTQPMPISCSVCIDGCIEPSTPWDGFKLIHQQL